MLAFRDLGVPTWLDPQPSLRFTKVLWINDPGTHTEVLVRPASGSPPTAFGHVDEPPVPETLFTAPGNSGGYIYFAAPGCYVFQIDGDNFTTRFTVQVS